MKFFDCWNFRKFDEKWIFLNFLSNFDDKKGKKWILNEKNLINLKKILRLKPATSFLRDKSPPSNLIFVRFTISLDISFTINGQFFWMLWNRPQDPRVTWSATFLFWKKATNWNFKNPREQMKMTSNRKIANNFQKFIFRDSSRKI